MASSSTMERNKTRVIKHIKLLIIHVYTEHGKHNTEKRTQSTEYLQKQKTEHQIEWSISRGTWGLRTGMRKLPSVIWSSSSPWDGLVTGPTSCRGEVVRCGEGDGVEDA